MSQAGGIPCREILYPLCRRGGLVVTFLKYGDAISGVIVPRMYVEDGDSEAVNFGRGSSFVCRSSVWIST